MTARARLSLRVQRRVGPVEPGLSAAWSRCLIMSTLTLKNATHPPLGNTHNSIPTFSLPSKKVSRGIHVLECMHTWQGSQKKGGYIYIYIKIREVEEEESSRTSRHVTVWTGMQRMRGERGARVELAERGRNICLHFPEPFSPSSFAFSSHGRQQPGREEREEEGGGEEKKKATDQKMMGESALIRCRTSPLH